MPRARRNDKRERLIEAANKLVYEQTFHTTTLADIAKLADVPLGNVYYYFKTKEAIMDAVLERRASEWQAMFTQWEQNPNIKHRLVALLEHNMQKSDTLARFGCEIGSLCQELGKQTSHISNSAAKLMNDILSWVEKQFQELGKGEKSNIFAEHFLANLQGMSLLTLTFKSPEYLSRQTKNLEQWLETV